jgi:WD40 repeat protein
VRRLPLRATWLALIIGGIATVGCGREAPSPALTATRLTTLDGVNPEGGYVDALALAPDAGLIATGERGGQIRVWATAGEPTAVALPKYRQAIVDLAFARDGRVLASLGRHRESALRLWRSDDSGTWTEAASLPVGRCLGLRFDGAGARLGVLCESEVVIVDLASMLETARVSNPYRAPLTAFDLSADGRRLITAGHDGELTVWDVVTATAVRTFSVKRSRRPHAPPRGLDPPEVWAVVVALSGDGSRAAAVTIEGTVYVWDVESGNQIFDHADGEAGGPPPGSLRFRADGGLLTTTGDRYGMRRIDVSNKAWRAITPTRRVAYQTVSITDNASAFAFVTPSAAGGTLSYAVEVWRIAAP